MSKRINWKKEVKRIPSKVLIDKKVNYDVVWQHDIIDTKGNHLCGLTDLDNKIIFIKIGMPARLTIETYFHEIFHAWSHEHEINLTEPQVLAMEKIVPFLIRKDNILKEE